MKRSIRGAVIVAWGNQNHVAGVKLVENAAELGAVGLRAAGRVASHLSSLAARNCLTCASMLWPSVDCPCTSP